MAVTENSYQARKALADFCWSQGQVNEALALYREAIQMRPGFEGAHLNLGAVLNQTGHVAEAIDEFKQAVQSKPDDPSAYNDLGAVLEPATSTSPSACSNERLNSTPITPMPIRIWARPWIKRATSRRPSSITRK